MKTGVLLVCCAMIIGLAGENFVWADTISTADGNGADTYLAYYNQGGNYGTETSFMVSKNHVPYMKLDFSAIGPNMITDANLALYGTPNPAEPPTYSYEFPIWGLLDGSDDWGESTIKYNNAPLVMNPITWNPLLVYLGRVIYTIGNEDAIFMAHTGGVPLVDFLNSRGPDGVVTLIIGSAAYTSERFFSTKEDHGDGSEAPFITFGVDPTAVQLNNWVGSDSNNWSQANNWLNESGSPDVPDGNAVVNITGGSNLPVVIDANATAKQLFVYSGGLKLVDGTLTLTDGVLRIKEGIAVDVTEGQIKLAGNVEGHMLGLIGINRIITSKPCQQEVYAAYDSNSNETVIKTRNLVRRLSWLNSIVEADGPLYPPGYPSSSGREAKYCVDGSGMIGNVAHVGSIEGGASVPPNYYCAYQMAFDEPTLKFTFDEVYNLTEMLVWNHEIGYAFNKVKIEYSTDDASYTTLMDGASQYFFLDYGNKDGTKNDVVSFGGVPAKYVKITAVGGPGTGNHETTSYYGTYILREVQFCHQGLKACEPNPANNFTAVDIEVGTLSWTPGTNATASQDVWFGTSAGAMTKIGNSISPCQDSISISTLESDKDYYWRVDANNGSGPITGNLWHFKTKQYLSWNPGGEGVVFAFGIKTSGGSKGYLAANGSGISGDLRDSTADSSMWYCANPSAVDINEPELYVEFDKIYNLDEMWVWNYPSSGGSATMAWKTIEIQYSTDGVNYSVLGTTFVLPQGNSDGTHDTEIPFGVPARYVRIKAIGGPGVGNYGSASYRLCEVRFYAVGPYTSTKAYDPAPADNSEVDVFTELEWAPGTAAVTGQDLWFGPTGSLVKIASNIGPDVSSYSFTRPLDNYVDYSWRVDGIDGNEVAAGDEWTFTTRARLRFNPVVIGIVGGSYSQGNGGSSGLLAIDWSGLTYDSHYSGTDTSVSGYSWPSHTWYCRKPWDVGITEPNLVVEFDRIYDINEMWIWNHDGTDTGSGDDEYHIAMKTIKVEYSTNGTSYTTLGTYVLPHGDPEGGHDTKIDFGDVPAKYVRVTATGGPGVGNYGSTTWGYKLRELRFYYEVPLWSDMNYSKSVDFTDYAIIAADWLEDNWTGEEPVPCPGKPAGDVTGDCRVDMDDIALFADEWLEDIN